MRAAGKKGPDTFITPMNSEPYVIVPAQGVGPCCIGANKQTAIDVFGRPRIVLGADIVEAANNPGRMRAFRRRWNRWWTAFWTWIRGVLSHRTDEAIDENLASKSASRKQATNAGGTPVSDFLQYHSLGVEIAYDGNDEITSLFFHFHSKTHRSFQGRTSLGIGINSTLDDVLKSYGAPTGTTDFGQNGQKHVRYDADGITFVFNQDLLEYIIVYKPQSTWWPAEWPHRPYTPNINWLAFKPAALTGPVMDAQATFLEFARVIEQDRLQLTSNYQATLIQAFVETTPGNPFVGEFVYLSDISTDGKEITGTLTASAACRADLVKGAIVTFAIDYLSDWYLVPINQPTGLGGFTIPYALAQLSVREQQDEMRLSPFCWFSHRSRISAEGELFAIPECSQCKRRYLGIDVNPEPKVCRICNRGGRRCDCPECGAPLIRFPDQPAICDQCIRSGEQK